MDWQDIETAPKDGTPILAVLKRENGDCYISVIMWGEYDEEWIYVHQYAADLYHEPTHWMPLPPPPETKTTGER